MNKVPAALRDLDHWVLWREVQRDGQKAKLPFQPNGTPAKSNDPATWHTLDACMDVADRYNGPGFVFAADGGFTGIDLDGCRDPATGEIAEWARRIIERLNSYSEVSPSGTGVKIWIRGTSPFPRGKKTLLPDAPRVSSKAPGIEVYSFGRYFAVTGWRLDGVSHGVERRQAELKALCAEHWPEPEPPQAPDTGQRQASTTNDDKVIERARAYIGKIPGAISGQRGHDTTFHVACVLVKGFGLSQADALAVVYQWNQTCQPPWTAGELQHKVSDAVRESGPVGYLRDALPDEWSRVQVPEYKSPDPGSSSQVSLANSDDTGKRVRIGAPRMVLLADVTPEPIRWLWPGRIARGKLTMIAGDPGVGKSLLSVDLAARISSGRGWPDCNGPCEPGGIVMISGEDDIADTIRPRLDAADADVRRISVVTGVWHQPYDADSESKPDPTERLFNLISDIGALEQAISNTPDCAVVIIDPITAYMGETDSHKNAEVRAALLPLSELAARTGVAIVAITHLRKAGGDAVHRPMGSLAFTAAARAVWGVVKDKEQEDKRLFLPVKSNLGPDTTGLAYEVKSQGPDSPPYISWTGETITITADEAMQGANKAPGPDPCERERAEQWLIEQLEAGAQQWSELETRASGSEGISGSTLRRGRDALQRTKRIECVRDDNDGRYYWRLPGEVDQVA
ncbi:MAG: AAA family ATPase [Planctomycetes bacterium]|nr:AAA family ATPase [Planctomycetota bacterium]